MEEIGLGDRFGRTTAVFSVGGNAKATIDQAKALPAKGLADASTGVSVLWLARRCSRGGPAATRSD